MHSRGEAGYGGMHVSVAAHSPRIFSRRQSSNVDVAGSISRQRGQFWSLGSRIGASEPQMQFLQQHRLYIVRISATVHLSYVDRLVGVEIRACLVLSSPLNSRPHCSLGLQYYRRWNRAPGSYMP